VHDFDTGHVVEEFAGEMLQRAAAGRAEFQLSGIAM